MKKPKIHMQKCARCGKTDDPTSYPDFLPEGWLHASDGKFCRKCKPWRLRH